MDALAHTARDGGSAGSGRAVIYADMWSAILKDVPRAVAVSLLATLCIVALSFPTANGNHMVILSP